MTARTPRTMSAEREAELRALAFEYGTDVFLPELDAERAISLALAEALKEKQCNCHTWGAFQCKRCIALAQYTAQNAPAGFKPHSAGCDVWAAEDTDRSCTCGADDANTAK